MLTPEFRDQLLAVTPEGRLVLTIYQGQVIGITPAQWDAFAAEMEKLANPSPNMQNIRRVAFAGYAEVVLDKQGRIQLPTHLRKSGKLERDVVLVGVGRSFEIWDKDRFEALLEQQPGDVSSEMSQANVTMPF